MKRTKQQAKERLEFIRANPNLKTSEMAKALKTTVNTVRSMCLYNDLPFVKCYDRHSVNKSSESEFFNIDKNPAY